jgi:hypothetical protein
MTDPYIAIISPFKTATTSLNTAFFNLNIRTFKYHGLNDYLVQQNPPNHFTHVFLLIRDPLSTYISAYFQDIDNDYYVYYYGNKEKILSSSIDQLIDHFQSFNWKSFDHVNHEYFYSCIEKYFNVTLKRIENENYWITKANNQHFIVLKTEYLDHEIDNICTQTGLPKLFLEKHNNSEDKWYGKKYKEMKEKILKNQLTIQK